MHHHQELETKQVRRGPRDERGERGASLVEYALLLALIAVVVFGAVAFFGSSTGGGFNKSTGCLKAAYNNTAAPAGC